MRAITDAYNLAYASRILAGGTLAGVASGLRAALALGAVAALAGAALALRVPRRAHRRAGDRGEAAEPRPAPRPPKRGRT
jgi:hypothetical protein